MSNTEGIKIKETEKVAKYRKGDLVVVKPDLRVGYDFGLYVNKRMTPFAGDMVEIESVNEYTYAKADYNIQGCKYFWTEDMFVKNHYSKFRVGDRVKVINDLDEDKTYKGEISGYKMNTSQSMAYGYAGEVVTIVEAEYSGHRDEVIYRIKEDSQHWLWVAGMFEGLVIEEQQSKPANEITESCGYTFEHDEFYSLRAEFGKVATGEMYLQKVIFSGNKTEITYTLGVGGETFKEVVECCEGDTFDKVTGITVAGIKATRKVLINILKGFQ